MIGIFPLRTQARLWVWWVGAYRDPRSSSWRLDAIRGLRRTSGLTHEEADMLIRSVKP